MSLNSLQDDMSRRAASMAAMAKRATNPQQIEAIQKSLITGVQSGAIQPYVGIPLIQELTKKITEVKAKMAQSMAGAGMQQPPQGQQAPQPPIAQQVMAQAAQADQSQGVEALRSNLPQSYAGGGIIAFEEGGPVERFQSTGYTGTTPAGRFFSGVGQNFTEANEMAKLRNKLQMQYGPASAVPGLFMRQTDEERLAAKAVAAALPNLSFPQLQQLAAEGPSALASFAAPTPATSTVTAPSAAPGGPGARIQPPPPAAPAAPANIGFKPTTLETYTPTIATMPVRKDPDLTDLNAITKDFPTKQKTIVDNAVTAEQAKLEAMDKPGNEAREELLSKRGTAQEKDSAIGRALNLMSLGFGIAGSKERSLAGALGNEGRQGIRDLIQGEAASRAARDRLDDARDNFEQQKVQAKKGNYQASQTAGREAGRDLLAATQFAYTSAQTGNAQGINMFNALSQSDVNKATVLNQAQQLNMNAVNQKNQNTVALAQLQQTGDIARAQLAAQEKRYAEMGEANRARIMQATAKGLSDFMQNEGAQLRAQLAKDYGPNFLTAKDLRSQQAADIFNKRKQAYLADIRGQAIDALSARQADALLTGQ